MRILVLFAHPVETSFGAAVHQTLLKTLRARGHEVDDCDLPEDCRIQKAEWEASEVA